jgi:hypothetical protein
MDPELDKHMPAVLRNNCLRVFCGFLIMAFGHGFMASAQAPDLPGAYDYVQERSDNVDAAIEAAVARVNFLVRSVARGRLKKTNQPYRRISLAVDGDTAVVTFDDKAAVRTPLDGSPIKWTRDDGEVFDVSTSWRGTTLVQTFAAEDGKRVNEFSQEAGAEHLALKVTVESGRLKQPLTYQLYYRRR